MVVLSVTEMNNLKLLWTFHRSDCHNQKDITIEMLSGGGIGSVVQATCGCGKVLDVTDYSSW
jgi:hypothetical protein